VNVTRHRLISDLQAILSQSSVNVTEYVDTRAVYSSGVTTFAVSKFNLDLLHESVATMTRIQEMGLGQFGMPWNVHATLFTSSDTMNALLQKLKVDNAQKLSEEESDDEAVVWPFDNIVMLDRIDGAVLSVDSCCEKCCRKPDQGSRMDKWNLKCAAVRYSPYKLTMYLDSDVYVCDSDGVQEYFEKMKSNECGMYISSDGQNGGGHLEEDVVPKLFYERNTGVMMYNAEDEGVRKIMELYGKKYVEQVGKNPSIGHDQPAMREVLYGMEQRGELMGTKVCELPRNVHCRGVWPFKTKRSLESLECVFTHGDNRIRQRRKFKLPCRRDREREEYRALVGTEVKWE